MTASRTDSKRTETEVAAEAVMAVVESGLIHKDARTIANVAAITSIPVAALRDAWRRIQDRGYRPPRDLPTLSLVPPPASSSPNLSRDRRPYKATHPTPETRICSKCGEAKPLSAYLVKNHKTGNVHTMCRDCSNAYKRERYVHIGEVKIAVELLEGDACIGHACLKCGKPFVVGERVVADNLRHEECG